MALAIRIAHLTEGLDWTELSTDRNISAHLSCRLFRDTNVYCFHVKAYKGWRSILRRKIRGPQGKVRSYDVITQEHPSVLVFTWDTQVRLSSDARDNRRAGSTCSCCTERSRSLAPLFPGGVSRHRHGERTGVGERLPLMPCRADNIAQPVWCKGAVRRIGPATVGCLFPEVPPPLSCRIPPPSPFLSFGRPTQRRF